MFAKLSILTLAFFSASIIIQESDGKIYEVCDLAQQLVQKYRIPQKDLADWMCLIKWGSNYNSSTVTVSQGGSGRSHGLFQISETKWCVEGKFDGLCGLDCNHLRDDDLIDDTICARRIHFVTQRKTGNGFDAWPAWKQHCQNQDVNSYISRCDFVVRNHTRSK